MSEIYTNLTLPITQPVGVTPSGSNIINILTNNLMANLTFHETLTVEQFKERTHVSKIDVRKNPNTGKLFFTYGAATGAVAAAGIPTHPMVSNVSGDEGSNFWLLHEEGTGGAPVLASF